MDFEYTNEQKQLQSALQRWIAKEYAFDARRKLTATEAGFSRDNWRTFAEFGLLGLTLPEAHDGLGGDAIDTMVVLETMGPGLVLEPYLPAIVIGAGLVADLGSEAQRAALLPQIAAGDAIAVLAHYEPGGRYELDRIATTARRDGDVFVLDGAKTVVLGGPQADRFLVSARIGSDAGISLFVVDRDAAGVAVRGYPTQDGARAAEVTLTSVHAGTGALLGAPGNALPAIEHAIDRGIAALCAEAAGIMAALNEATLEYLKTRAQFGGPIGRFQALQHRMVDMHIACEEARSMAILASDGVRSPDPAERRRTVSMAKARVGQTARFVGQEAVQMHGGMGVVDELIVSHWFKRLTVIDTLFGDADHHLARFSDSMPMPA